MPAGPSNPVAGIMPASSNPIIHRRSSSLPGVLPPVPPLKIIKGPRTPQLSQSSFALEISGPLTPATPPLTPLEHFKYGLPTDLSTTGISSSPSLGTTSKGSTVGANSSDSPTTRPRQLLGPAPISSRNKSARPSRERAALMRLSPPVDADDLPPLLPPLILSSPPSLDFSGDSDSSLTDVSIFTRGRVYHKHQCIRELYETERVFAKDMDLVVRNYLFNSMSQPNLGLSERQLDKLFSNITQVLDVSLGLVAMIESMVPYSILHADESSPRTVKGDPETNIGRAMLSFLNPSMYTIFEEYSHRNTAQMKVCFTLPKDPRTPIGRWLHGAQAESRKHTTAWALDALLIKPVQRLGKYPLFLQALVSNTPSDHPDFHDLQRALRRATHYVECINKRFDKERKYPSKRRS